MTPASTGLPHELIYLYLIAPFLAAPILKDDLFNLSGMDVVRGFSASCVPFWLIPIPLHVLYAFVMPHLLPRVSAVWLRALLHATIISLVAIATAVVILPLHNWVGQCTTPMLQWLITSVVITWTFMLPALVVQDLRAKTEAHERRLQEERRIALQAQLEAIRARTNPHFLFNAMNTIASLIQDDPDQAEVTLERLADVLRYALKSSQRDTVTLETELEMIEDYLEIQTARFGSRLTYRIDVPSELKTILLPPLLLQPLVENAVLHGISPKSEGGTIEIRAEARHGQVTLTVEDDGSGPQASTHKGHGVGLSDLKDRLQLLYQDRGILDAHPNSHGGFTVQVSLPLVEA